MATIRAYTTIEQSRELAEILPLESADMSYEYQDECDGNFPYYSIPVCYPPENNKDIPCWSLAALLNVLPNNENISTNLSKGGYRISTLEYTNSWFVDYEDETNGLNNCVTSSDNPIDACYEMIIRLNELNLL